MATVKTVSQSTRPPPPALPAASGLLGPESTALERLERQVMMHLASDARPIHRYLRVVQSVSARVQNDDLVQELGQRKRELVMLLHISCMVVV